MEYRRSVERTDSRSFSCKLLPNFGNSDKMQIFEPFVYSPANCFRCSFRKKGGVVLSAGYFHFIFPKIIAVLILCLCQVYKRFCDNEKITMPITPEEEVRTQQPTTRPGNGQQIEIQCENELCDTNVRSRIQIDPRNSISSGKFIMSFVQHLIEHSSFGMRQQQEHLFSQNETKMKPKWYDNYDSKRKGKSCHVLYLSCFDFFLFSIFIFGVALVFQNNKQLFANEHKTCLIVQNNSEK